MVGVGGVIRAKELRLYVVALCLFFWSGMWELRMSLCFSVFSESNILLESTRTPKLYFKRIAV